MKLFYIIHVHYVTFQVITIQQTLAKRADVTSDLGTDADIESEKASSCVGVTKKVSGKDASRPVTTQTGGWLSSSSCFKEFFPIC